MGSGVRCCTPFQTADFPPQKRGGRPPAAPPQSFAALRHPGYRAYFVGSALAMMADSIEHVISYWIIFQKFHSPALGGFAMLSHWLPFLFFSVLSGALADRFDPRRIIQIGMALFVAASLGWGVLFLTGTLQMWHAAALLVIHGFAGVFWHPSAQLLIHDIVGTANLQSAVRLSATARYLGLLLGPAVGGVLLLALGPAHGLLLNRLIYLPLVLWPWTAAYTLPALLLPLPWGRPIGGFAASTSHALAPAILFAVGFLELSFNAMAQTLVQLPAPAPIRGRVIGLYILFALGMRAFSGLTIGVVGGLIGIHWSLALSALVLLAVTVALLAFTLRRA